MRLRRVVLSVAAVAIVAVTAGAAGLATARPSNDRIWAPEHALLPSAAIAGDSVRIRQMRNFTYAAEDRFTPAYEDRSYDLSKLESAWFVVTPFSRWWRGPAHTFVSFGFADLQYVAISVEARREPDEHYAVLTGLFKRFEVIYVIGDERDLIGSRALFGGYDVFLYPIRAPREKIRQMFVEMLQRANALRATPEFYNTATNNCTTNVVAHVNHVAPGTVPAGIKTIIPGYTDEVAHRLGLIDSAITLDEARYRYRVNDRARQFAGRPDFSLRIREVGAASAVSAH
jgi:hypothetical protein